MSQKKLDWEKAVAEGAIEGGIGGAIGGIVGTLLLPGCGTLAGAGVAAGKRGQEKLTLRR